jgi:hypothetical protein
MGPYRLSLQGRSTSLVRYRLKEGSSSVCLNVVYGITFNKRGLFIFTAMKSKYVLVTGLGGL